MYVGALVLRGALLLEAFSDGGDELVVAPRTGREVAFTPLIILVSVVSAPVELAGTGELLLADLGLGHDPQVSLFVRPVVPPGDFPARHQVVIGSFDTTDGKCRRGEDGEGESKDGEKGLHSETSGSEKRGVSFKTIA